MVSLVKMECENCKDYQYHWKTPEGWIDLKNGKFICVVCQKDNTIKNQYKAF